MNLKEKGAFMFCVLHLPFNNGYHNYIASSVIAPRIFNQQELILFQSLIIWVSNCLNQLILFFFVLRLKQFKIEIKLQFQTH